jgi:excisionase family DNA binding protein
MKLIDVKTLSEVLSVKPKTIYYLVHKKAIPFVRIQRLVRFDMEQIQMWVEHNKHNVEDGNHDES